MPSRSRCVQVNRNIHAVFSWLTDRAHVEILFEHVKRLESPAPAHSKHSNHGTDQLPALDTYRQTRYLHGVGWQETVTVLRQDAPHHYELRIDMFGVETRYGYLLTALDDNRTSIQLAQTAHGKGLWKILYPLIHHVFSQPEHDGQHLVHLKQVLEQTIQPLDTVTVT